MTLSNHFTRRQWLAAAAACVVVLPRLSAAAPLPVSEALAVDLNRALSRGAPLLVMVSLDGCPYCKLVRENYLAPMHEREGLAVVQINMRNKATVIDFNGKPWTQDALIRSWGVTVAPTVLFFGAGGVEVAERLVGASIPDFYGAYLDERLKTARLAVRV